MNPFIEIIRPFTSFLSAFGVFVGAVVAGVPISISMALAIMASFLISGAGIVLNDYYDIDIDRINAPKRPLPSGRMGKRAALAFGFILFAAGIVMAYFINAFCLAIAALNTVLEILYARNFKKIAILGNATDSWFVASTFLFGAAISADFTIASMLAALAFLANMGREIFGDMEDLEGDKALGLKTLPVIAGTRISRISGSVFILAAVAMSALPYYMGLLSINYVMAVAVADAIFIISIFQDPVKNQKTTKIAMLAALLAFLLGSI